MFQQLLKSVNEFFANEYFEDPPEEVLQMRKLSTLDDVDEEIRLMGWDSAEEFMEETDCESYEKLVGTYVQPDTLVDPVGKLRRGSKIRVFQVIDNEVTVEAMQSWLDEENNVFVDLDKMF